MMREWDMRDEWGSKHHRANIENRMANPEVYLTLEHIAPVLSLAFGMIILITLVTLLFELSFQKVCIM